MYSYRIELELRTGLGTPLAADTLWGHVAWGLRYSSGQAALMDWLARYDRGDPPLVLSDPLPAGFFPRPAVPPVRRSGEPLEPQEADRRKRLGKVAWIGHGAWQRVNGAVSGQAVEHAIADAQTDAAPAAPATASVAHAAINRLTGGTAQPGGGTLFTLDQTYYERHPRFDVWALSTEPAITVRQWFEAGLAGGYGRDAATGLGHLVVHSVAAAELPSANDANAVLLLGPAVPKPGDPHRGFFNSGVRSGRVGGEFAIGLLPDGSASRQKRPVRCLLAGTVLIGSGALPRFIGRVIEGVHTSVPEIRHYGMAPVLPCRLEDGLLDHPLLAGPAETPAQGSRQS